MCVLKGLLVDVDVCRSGSGGCLSDACRGGGEGIDGGGDDSGG